MPRNSRAWRQLTVWLHVVTSVGWMTTTLALFTLLALAATTADHGTRVAAVAMAHHLDRVLLAPLGNASAATGLVLSLGTAWGLTHHRWVLAKFVLTVVQFTAGVFVLSAVLNALAEAPEAPSTGLLAGTAAMVAGIAFQAWLSVAKPGGRTRWARHRLPTAPPWVFAAAVLAPLTDIAVGTALGFPAPVLSLVVVVVAVVVRRRALATPAPGAGYRPLDAPRRPARAGCPRRGTGGTAGWAR